MPRAAITVAEIFRRYGDTFRAEAGATLSTAQRRVMTAIERCRTAALGGHVEQCDHCGHRRVWYNSCRNRHCPTCQSLARAAWLERRRADLLPTEYFHVVFTVPPAVAEVATQNKAVVYGLLFRAVADTLRTIAADPRHLGAEIGSSPSSTPGARRSSIIRICTASSRAGGWRATAAAGLPAAPGSSCRSGFSHATSAVSSSRRCRTPSSPDSSASRAGCSPSATPGASPSTSARPARPSGWSTRSDPSPAPNRSSTTSAATPTGSPSATSACAASGTHRSGGSRCSGSARSRRRQKTMTLTATEFIRRMLLHVLPPGFHRIRYYGFLANRTRQQKLTECRRLLSAPPPPPAEQAAAAAATDYRDRYEALTGRSLRRCPRCDDGSMLVVVHLAGGWTSPAILDSS